jgi:pilus assembly protein TadC
MRETMAKIIIEKRFSSFFKPRGSNKVDRLLAFAGVESEPGVWLGSRLLIVLLFAIIGALIPLVVFPIVKPVGYPLISDPSLSARIISAVLFAAGGAIASGLLIYMHLYYLISDRTSRVEAVLPDFLMMISANMRSGMTPFEAFQASARPEFGPLQTEVRYVSSSSLGSESFSDALKGLTMTIDSSVLRRTISFFENGLRSGGRLAYLLETSAEEIREAEDMKRQMIINTKTYAIFLVFILMFGLPLLLSISTQFLAVFTKIQANISEDSQKTMISGLSASKAKIDPKFIDQMTIVIIVGSSILTSVLVGLISEGKLLYGLKYFPPLAFASGFFFWVFRSVISGFVGNLG